MHPFYKSSTPPVEASGYNTSSPAKKRGTVESMSRTTEHLNLQHGEFNATQRVQLNRLLSVLHEKRRIVALVGAGISVSAGSTLILDKYYFHFARLTFQIVPDFRSTAGLFSTPGNGPFQTSLGKDLFDASVYHNDASTSFFHDMLRTLSASAISAKPTAFHHLLATLAHDGRLLRLYSQNIDGIDTAMEPLRTEVPLPKKAPWPKTIQLHGCIRKMVCSKCYRVSNFRVELFNGPIQPSCVDCEDNHKLRVKAGKRSHGVGNLRPRIVLYNGQNPDDEAIGSVIMSDLRARPDAFIVAGTTLKVPGARRIVREMCRLVRDRVNGITIWISKEAAPKGKDLENCWDLVVTGSCDEVAQYAAMRRWDQELEYSKTKHGVSRDPSIKDGNAKVRSVSLESVEVPKRKRRQLLLSPSSLKIPQKVTGSKRRKPKVSTGSDTLKVGKVVGKRQVQIPQSIIDIVNKALGYNVR
jgi:NAD-dependent histone deacetylase SIR2